MASMGMPESTPTQRMDCGYSGRQGALRRRRAPNDDSIDSAGGLVVGNVDLSTNINPLSAWNSADLPQSRGVLGSMNAGRPLEIKLKGVRKRRQSGVLTTDPQYTSDDSIDLRY